MERIGAHPVTHHFRQDLRAARLGEFQFLDHQNPGAFANHEAVAILVPGTRRPLGIVIARGERPHRRKPADAHRRDRRLRTAADHRDGFAALNHAERIANRVGAGGARGRGGRIRPLGSALDRHVAGGQIDDGRRNEKGRNAARSVFQQGLVLALDHFESADPAADVDADFLGDFRRHLQAGILQGEIRRRNGELDETPHLLDFFLLDITARIETFDLSCDPAGKGRCVKRRNTRDAALGSKNGSPRQFGSNPQRRQQSDAGHYDSS